MAPLDPNGVGAALRRLHDQQQNQEEVLKQLQGFMSGVANVPKWIEEIPGKRSPFFLVVDVNFTANSTTRREGTESISTDGPFVCTGIALFFKKTEGAYQGVWGPATAFGSKISTVSQQHGFATIFDQPNCASFTVEITAHGSDRNWQSQAVSSALYSPEAGGAYILPASHLFGRNSSIRLALTPDVSMPYTCTVQGIFLGYKIVQGATYQP